MKEGKWKGKTPTHRVPEQEEGEPPAKQPTHEGEQPGAEAEGGTTTPESLPELEEPWTAEGKHVVEYGILLPSMGQGQLSTPCKSL